MEKGRWRGTWGVGDFMLALQVCHNYCYKNNTKVNLEMHWETKEGHLETPQDPETIVERMEWIHNKFYRQEDVTVTHVYESDLFLSGNVNPDKNKKRFYFESGAFDDEPAPPNDWVFKKEYYRPRDKGSGNKIVMWTPTYNTEPPRKWKRFLTNDDWHCIIKLLRREGWILDEITYRTPIEEAFTQIQNADYVFCYDGMWHYIAGMFATPIFIPSWEGISKYACPQAVLRPNRKYVMEFVESFTKEGHKHMRNKSDRYLARLGKFYED